MMTIQNLGLQESVGVRFKYVYVPNCPSSSGLKSIGIFVILLSQDSFESYCPERKS